MHHRVKFHADWSNRFVDMAIYRHLGFLTVFRDCGSLLLVYCILKNSRFCLLSRFGGQMYVIVPNFALIGQTVSEIWLFFDFSRWRPSAILNFVKIRNFNFRSGSEAQYASSTKFREDRLNRSRDMADFRFFKMAAVRHLGLVLRVLGPPTKSTWWSL